MDLGLQTVGNDWEKKKSTFHRDKNHKMIIFFLAMNGLKETKENQS